MGCGDRVPNDWPVKTALRDREGSSHRARDDQRPVRRENVRRQLLNFLLFKDADIGQPIVDPRSSFDERRSFRVRSPLLQGDRREAEAVGELACGQEFVGHVGTPWGR